jgi:hypothetical protein
MKNVVKHTCSSQETHNSPLGYWERVHTLHFIKTISHCSRAHSTNGIFLLILSKRTVEFPH